MYKLLDRIIHRYLLKRSRILDVKLSKVNKEKIDKWMLFSYKDFGFMHYYTLRKRNILDMMTDGVNRKEYWKLIGRISELETMAANIKVAKGELEKKKRAKKKKKSGKRVFPRVYI